MVKPLAVIFKYVPIVVAVSFGLVMAVYMFYALISFKVLGVVSTDCHEGFARCAGRAVHDFTDELKYDDKR